MNLLQIWNEASDAWLTALVRASWQGGLALGLVWGLLRLLPRTAPRIQCWLWRLALVKLLAAFLWGAPLTLAILPPPAGNTVSMAAASQGAHGIEAEVPASPPDTLTLSAPAAPLSGTGTPTASPFTVAHSNLTLTLANAFLALWLAGVLWQAARVFGQWRVTRRLSRTCSPLWDGALLSAGARISHRLGLRRTPVLAVCEGTVSPLLLGAMYPSIVLPAAVLAPCELKEQELILAHELAHIRRCDLLWAWLPILARVLFCFHLMVWLALRELTAAQEMDCDAVALVMTGGSISEYGALLIRVAEQRPRNTQSGPAMIGMADSYGTLKRRLFAMKSLSSISPVRLKLTGAALVVVGIAGIVPWRVAAQGRPALPPPASGASAQGHPASPPASPPSASSASAGTLLQTKAGKYTISIDKIEPISVSDSGGSSDPSDSGPHFAPNLAITLGVTAAAPDDLRSLAGLSPQANAIDARGARVGKSPASETEKTNGSHTERTAALYLRLPDTSVKKLRSLEGELVVSEGKLSRVKFTEDELRAGAQKRVDATTVQVTRVQSSPGYMQVDLVVKRPGPMADPAVEHDPQLIAERLKLPSPTLEAELSDNEERSYDLDSMTASDVSGGGFTSSSTSSFSSSSSNSDGSNSSSNNDGGNASGIGNGNAAGGAGGSASGGGGAGGNPETVNGTISLQKMHVKFRVPANSKSQKSLTLTLFASTGKTQRIPFKFTDIPLTYAQ